MKKHSYFFRAHEKYTTKKARYQKNVSDIIFYASWRHLFYGLRIKQGKKSN